jgi:hypothetical protein
MKIIKSFDDPYIIPSFVSTELSDMIVSWGLTKDGILCYKKKFIDPNILKTELDKDFEWKPYYEASFGLPISVMKKIISEFEKLLPFV